MPHFFISYRRNDQDGRYLAHMLFRELRNRYGEQSLFLDVDSRSPGLSFPMKVDRALNRTDVVLVIIGPAWMKLLIDKLEDSRDWVRYEIAESLKRSCLPVVPICVHGVDMPQPHQLPEDLRELGFRDGIVFDPFQDFDSHLNRFLADTEQVLETFRAEKEELRLARSKLVALLVWRAHQLQLSAEKAAAAEAEAVKAAEAKAEASRIAAARAASAKAAAVQIEAAQVAAARAREWRLRAGYTKRHASGPGTEGHPTVEKEPDLPLRGLSSPRTTSDESNHQRPEYYRLSGRFTVLAMTRGFLIGGMATLGLSFAYAYSLLYIPFVEFNFLLTGLFGLLSGIGTGLALMRQKVRNTTVTAMVGLVLGIGAVYASWLLWISGARAGANTFFELATSPLLLWQSIVLLNRSGSWDIVGYRPHGVVLGMIWGIEAITIICLSTFFAWIVELDEQYCESCNSWCASASFVTKLRSCEADELRRRLERRDFAVLGDAPVYGTDDLLRVKIRQCEKCGLTNTLAANLITVTFDERNRKSEKSNTVIDGLLITSAECSAIKKYLR